MTIRAFEEPIPSSISNLEMLRLRPPATPAQLPEKMLHDACTDLFADPAKNHYLVIEAGH
jgi:hypothetical protein